MHDNTSIKKIKNFSVADWFTSFRIVGAVSLIFFKPFSVAFYIIICLCGISDVADGLIARATKTTSTFGARLDSIADLLFYTITLLKILPTLLNKLPTEIWYCVAVVIIIRVASYIVAAIRFKAFASLHSYLNKATGLMIFFVPYIIRFSWSVIYCWALCFLSGISSLTELVYHITKKINGTNKA
jgi:CDP-diacylglycerol--glycerol-3-phosphate 3-phosphatidyltransferase